ncbi:MAG: PilZ domain-containing protein [Desulfobacterales bacterium]|jgi:c-di-GMP-binding flagellar brake protein YcgR
MTPQEKRKHARIDSLNLSYFCLDENNQIIKQGMGRTLNVSESGILLETHFPIDKKHTIALTVGLEEDLVEITGRPVHSHTNDDGKYEVGIEFLKINAKARKVLKQFIDAFQLKGA